MQTKVEACVREHEGAPGLDKVMRLVRGTLTMIGMTEPLLRVKTAALATLVGGAFALFAQTAQAVVINLDPGPVGSSSPILTYDVTADVNAAIGSTADGGSHVLDFVFTDMKTIVSPFATSQPVPYNFALLLEYTNTLTVTLPPAPVVFISDENGANIGDATFVDTAYLTSFGGATDGTVRYNAIFSPNVDSDVFSDIHFSIVLPNAPGAGPLLSAELFGSSDFPFVVDQLVVAVSEPAALPLLGLGILGLLAFGLRRRGGTTIQPSLGQA